MAKKKIKRNEVEKSLKDQLIAMGASIPVFIDLINDYMGLWDLKSLLNEDIKARGVVYDDVSSVGVPMKKNNPSVKELVNVNKQMLTLLDKLGLNTSKCKTEEPEGDGDL